jgi:hypothetical protein
MKFSRIFILLALLVALICAPDQIAAQGTYKSKVLSVSPGNLLIYLPLDEAIGTTAYDASGNNLNSTYTSVTLASVLGPGGHGNAPGFDGINDYILLPLESILSYRDQGTLSMWVYATSTSSINALSLTNGAAAPNKFSLLVNRAFGFLSVQRDAGNGTSTVVFVATNTGQWYHLAAKWSVGSELEMFLNGSSVGTSGTLVAAAGTTALDNTKKVIGAFSTSLSFWKGSVAHVAIWNTPLSAAQIASLADPNGLSATSTPIPTPQLLQYATLSGSGQAWAINYEIQIGDLFLSGLLIVLVTISLFGLVIKVARRA